MMTEVMVGSFLRGADGWDRLWRWKIRFLATVSLCSRSNLSAWLQNGDVFHRPSCAELLFPGDKNCLEWARPAAKNPIGQPGWSIGFCEQTLGGGGGETATGHRGLVVGRAGDPTPDGVAGGDDRRNQHGERGEGEHAGDGQVGHDDGGHGGLVSPRDGWLG